MLLSNFSLFLVNFIAISGIRNGNPLTGQFYARKYSLSFFGDNFLIFFLSCLEIDRKFSKLNNLPLVLYTKGFFDILTDYISFLEFLENRLKIFKIDVFSSEKLFFVDHLTNVFYKYSFNSTNPLSKKFRGLGFLPSKFKKNKHLLQYSLRKILVKF